MLPRAFALIGSDRCLTPGEVDRAVQPHALTATVWDVYARQFQAFTGASIDPLFHRLAHPAAHQGAVRLDEGTAVVVVGTGPSLGPNLAALKRMRRRVRIFTSPRGAEALLPHGIVPDLVIVEHQTALDAHTSARHAGDRGAAVLPACPLVAAEWRTPPALLAGVPAHALFVPAPLPTWGLWPATAVAMAVEARAGRVALLGIDLGTPERIDPAHVPLAAVLELIARLAPVVALDCGSGAAKRGWTKAALAAAAGREVRGACDVSRDRAPAAAQRLADAGAALNQVSAIVDRARAIVALAMDARARRAHAPVARLETAAAEMMQWREDLKVRIAVQEGLGAAFLPRLWRLGIDPAIGPALWRPLLLAGHELVHQAGSLQTALSRAEAA